METNTVNVNGNKNRYDFRQRSPAVENKKGSLKLALLLVSSLTIMSVITISPTLPQMSRVFSKVIGAELLVKLVLTIPALMIALCARIAGNLIDRHGRLKILWAALLLYAISVAAGFFLNNLYHILLSRAILGISVGMSMTIVITLIADYFEGVERQKFLGIQIAFMSLAGILFIGLGGIMADISWRYPLLIYLFSLLVLPLAMMFLEEPKVIKTTDQKSPHIKAPSIIWMLFINTMFMWTIFFIIPVQIPFYLKAIGIERNSLIGAAIATSTAFSAISSFSYSVLLDASSRCGYTSINKASTNLVITKFPPPSVEIRGLLHEPGTSISFHARNRLSRCFADSGIRNNSLLSIE